MTDHTEHGTTFSPAALAARVAALEAQQAADAEIARLARAWHAAVVATAKVRAAVPPGLTPLAEAATDHPAVRAWGDAARADQALLSALRKEVERDV